MLFCGHFSSCGGPSQLNECRKWSKHCKHMCEQDCICKHLCTMVHLCMWICTCALLLIFASCVWQSPWPLTTVLEPMRAADWRTGGPRGLKELGPLSMITLIMPTLCNNWLATGFISRYSPLWISTSLIYENDGSAGNQEGWCIGHFISGQVYFLVLPNDPSWLKCSWGLKIVSFSFITCTKNLR